MSLRDPIMLSRNAIALAPNVLLSWTFPQVHHSVKAQLWCRI
jgi:hypothetical protein